MRYRTSSAAAASAVRCGRIGRVPRAPTRPHGARRAIVSDDALDREVEALATAIDGDSSVLVVGERGQRAARRDCGAGRRPARRRLARCSRRARPRSTPGMTYIGELEAQCSGSSGRSTAQPVLWIVPRFDELLYAGVTPPEPRRRRAGPAARGHGNATARRGEVDPAGYERLLRERPAVRDAFESCGSSRSSEEPRSRSPPRLGDRAVLREALALGRHFLGDAALPGALLLDAMRRRPATRHGCRRRAGDDRRALRAAAVAARRARAARRRRAAARSSARAWSASRRRSSAWSSGSRWSRPG